MREIKFRAWNAISRTMVAHNDIPFLINQLATTTYKVMQFTGLQVGSAELYEGDIVGAEIFYQPTADPDSATTCPFKGTVEFIDCAFMVRDIDGKEAHPIFWQDLKIHTILGNIHQRPELLK